MSKLEEILAAHGQPSVGPISYEYASELLRQAKYDGPVTVHWRGGIPRRIELGKPITVELKTQGIPGVLSPP